MELWNDALEGQSRRRLSHPRLSANTAMLRTACFLCVIGHRELLVMDCICAAQTAPIGRAHEGRVVHTLLLRHAECPRAAKALAVGLLVAACATRDKSGLEVGHPLPDAAVQVRDPPIVLLSTTNQWRDGGSRVGIPCQETRLI